MPSECDPPPPERAKAAVTAAGSLAARSSSSAMVTRLPAAMMRWRAARRGCLTPPSFSLPER